MRNLLSGLAMMLVSFTAFADDEAVAVAPPQVDSDPTGLIAFAVVFVGLIGAYAYVIWKSEKKKKNQGK
jgi:membrane-bound ClpP family serine protease